MIRSSSTTDEPIARSAPRNNNNSSSSSSNNNSASNSTSRSLVAKLVNPFAAKQRSPVEHEIKLDEPFRTFTGGDAVRGAVLLHAPKPIRITHLVIRLHGFVKVVNNARLPGDSIPYDENLLTSMKSRRGIEYFGNGFARLFEDEFILCGDGRLFGRYEFRFELTVPSEGIPSSIDFEHGTITYLLSSTITRPTTISPTMTCHQKLNILGNVDIAQIPVPRVRTVSLEAVRKRTKPRIRAMRRNTGPQPGREPDSTPTEASSSLDHISTSSVPGPDAPPQSPVPSLASNISAGSSAFSASNTIQRPLPGDESNPSSDNLPSLPSTGGYEKHITAHTELLQGGCLPGDVLSLRVTVDHTKPIKAMQGIVVTIFRQGRIDTHPAIPLGPMNNANRRQYEDYYPRSWTGLGGLSLSSAGSSRVFRQDLAQNLTPLIVDPQTLTAVVKTSIQMPDHVFPTISCAPGDMVSFRYYVEIVIDLRSKTAGQERFMPHFNIVDGPRHAYGDAKVSKVAAADGVSYSTTPGFNYLITDQIRRTRGVVFTTSEIIVGTKDSARWRRKAREGSDASNYGSVRGTMEGDGGVGNGDFDDADGEHEWSEHDWNYEQEMDRSSPAQQAMLPEPNGYYDVPPPEIDESTDEKAQIRRAEQRLLPSSAPDDGNREDMPGPSAPFAYDEEDFMNRYGFGAPAPAYDGPSAPTVEQLGVGEKGALPSLDTQSRDDDHVQAAPQDSSTAPEVPLDSPRTVVMGREVPPLPNGLAPHLHEHDHEALSHVTESDTIAAPESTPSTAEPTEHQQHETAVTEPFQKTEDSNAEQPPSAAAHNLDNPKSEEQEIRPTGTINPVTSDNGPPQQPSIEKDDKG